MLKLHRNHQVRRTTIHNPLLPVTLLFVIIAMIGAACTVAPSLSGPIAEQPTDGQPGMPSAGHNQAGGTPTFPGDPGSAPPLNGTPPANTPLTSAPVVVGQYRNLFDAILADVSLPEGWQLQPGGPQEEPYLQVLMNGEVLGSHNLLLYPLSNSPDLLGLFERAGLPPQPSTLADPANAETLLAVLSAYAAEFLTSVEADRKASLPPGSAFLRLETEAIHFGSLPGVAYGFAIAQADGKVFSREISYLATDGEIVYVTGTGYNNGGFGAYPSDALLAEFEPIFRRIVASLKIPLPVAEAEVGQVQALQEIPLAQVPLPQVYAGLPPVEVAPAGEILKVTGARIDGRMLRVACPEDPEQHCWIPNETSLIQAVFE